MSMYCTPILNITYKSIVSLGTFHPFPFLFSLFIIQIFLNSFLLNIISFLVKRISTDTCTSYYYLINSLFKINTLNSASLFKKLGKTDSKYRIKIAQFWKSFHINKSWITSKYFKFKKCVVQYMFLCNFLVNHYRPVDFSLFYCDLENPNIIVCIRATQLLDKIQFMISFLVF